MAELVLMVHAQYAQRGVCSTTDQEAKAKGASKPAKAEGASNPAKAKGAASVFAGIVASKTTRGESGDSKPVKAQGAASKGAKTKKTKTKREFGDEWDDIRRKNPIKSIGKVNLKNRKKGRSLLEEDEANRGHHIRGNKRHRRGRGHKKLFCAVEELCADGSKPVF
jgi:hypothetical protein